MKLFAAAVIALSGLAAAAVPPPEPRAAAPADRGLRQALEEFFRQEPEPNPPPRQLSPDERAQLRRQLNEYGRLPPPRPTTHTHHR